MRKLLNKPWFVAVLALAALAFVGQSLLPQRNGSLPNRLAAVLPRPEPVDGADPVGTTAQALPSTDLASIPLPPTQRDPFTPLITPPTVVDAEEPARPDLIDTVHLSALWSQDGETWVLLNGSIHQAGDTIGRLKIDSASQDGIWLSHWKGRDHLDLGGNFTLKTPAPDPDPAANEP